MKKTYRNVSTYDFRKQKYEVNNGTIITVPNEALSPRELLINFVKGGAMPREKAPIFEGGGFDDDDPTRRPDFDLADYTAEINKVYQRGLERGRAEKEKSLKANPSETERHEDDRQPPPDAAGGSEADDASKGGG